MRISESICLFLNNFFPKRKFRGRESTESYSEAQYSWAPKSYAMHERFLNLKDKVVLDAGCGPGGKTVYYAEKGCKSITGIDIDESRIQNAKDFALKKNAPNVNFIVGSLMNLPFENDTFDFIVMNDVFEHVDRKILIKALEECKRVIKPSGKICLEFPPWSSYDAAHLYDYIYIPWCQVFFSTKTLVNVINKINPDKPRMGKLTVVEHFLELNRITIKGSKKMFLDLNFKIISFEPVMLLKIKLFKFIPFFHKYLTRRMTAVLEK